MRKTRTHPILTLSSAGALVLITACATSTSPRSESANSAAPPVLPPAPHQEMARPAAGQPTAEDESESSPREQPEGAGFATPPGKSKELHLHRETAPKSAIAPARGAARKPAPASEQVIGSGELLQDRLRPVPSDPALLRTAIEDLLNAADELSTGHSCEHGCKAYQSMQRAAHRICELAPSNDPLARCTSARSKVSEADQEIKKRCGSCAK